MGTGKYSINEREFSKRFRRYRKPYDAFVYFAHQQLLEEIYDDIDRLELRQQLRQRGRNKHYDYLRRIGETASKSKKKNKGRTTKRSKS